MRPLQGLGGLAGLGFKVYVQERHLQSEWGSCKLSSLPASPLVKNSVFLSLANCCISVVAGQLVAAVFRKLAP